MTRTTRAARGRQASGIGLTIGSIGGSRNDNITFRPPTAYARPCAYRQLRRRRRRHPELGIAAAAAPHRAHGGRRCCGLPFKRGARWVGRRRAGDCHMHKTGKGIYMKFRGAGGVVSNVTSAPLQPHSQRLNPTTLPYSTRHILPPRP
eukprot:SAG11_NODE_1397_length_5032_cov_14.008109_1_plen_147_part_10